METGMTHATTPAADRGADRPVSASPVREPVRVPAREIGPGVRQPSSSASVFPASAPAASAPAVSAPRQQGSPVQRVTDRPRPCASSRRTVTISDGGGAAATVRRLSEALTRDLVRTARELTGTLGRRARAAGALAVLAGPVAGLAPHAHAQGAAPPPAPGVSTFDSGPTLSAPAPRAGGAFLPPTAGFAEPEQVFRGNEARNPLFLATDSPFQTRGRLENNIGDGRGYEDGYLRANAFIPWLFADRSTLFFMDVGGFHSYEAGGGFNLGLGVRRYFGGLNRTVGGNIWFDSDSGFEDDVTFNRLGVGLESIGKAVSWRVNGYLPIDDDERVFRGITQGPTFLGRSVIQTETEIRRLAYGGVEGEVGGPLPVAGQYGASGFVGAYALTHDEDEDALGFSSRLDLRLSDDLNVGGKLTTDDVFGTNVWATIALSTPRGSWYDFMRTGWFRDPSVFESMDSAVVRQERAMSRRVEDVRTEAFTDGAGNAIVVCHVDPNAAGGGDGTIENPFGDFDSLLTGANCVDASCDIVRVVAPAGGATLVTDGPINLQPNQQLLSSGVQQFVTASFRGRRQSLRLPGFTGGSVTLQNGLSTPSYVIGLNDNNVVSGFTIDGTTPAGDPIHDGIISIGPKATLPADFNTLDSRGTITSFNINRNTLVNVRDGVDLEHAGSGRGLFTDNLLVGGSRAGAGFDVEAQGGSLDLIVARNSISGFVGEDLNRNDVLDAGEDFRFIGTPTEGQFVRNFGYGIRVASLGGADVNAAITDNTVIGNEIGVSLQADGSTLTADVTGDNQITLNTGRTRTSGRPTRGSGLDLQLDNGATLTASVADAVISNNGATPTAANLFADAAQTIPSPDLGTQILGDVNGGSTLNLDLQDSTIARDARGGDGVAIYADELGGPDSAVNFLAENNTITGRAPAVFSPTVPLPAQERLAGINLVQNNGNLNAVIGSRELGRGNVLTDNAGAGVAVRLGGDAEGAVAVLGNTITGTDFDEVNIAPPVTVAGLTAARNDPGQFTPYQGDGVYLLTEDTSSLNGAVVAGNTITENAGEGVDVIATDAGTIQGLRVGQDDLFLTGDTNVISGNAVGVRLRREGVAIVDDADINGNLITGNAINGVLIQADGADNDPLDVGIANNTITANGGFTTGVGDAGVRVNSSGDVIVDLEALTFNNISNNIGDGILLTGAGQAITDAGTVIGEISNNTVDGNSFDGFHSQTRTGNIGEAFANSGFGFRGTASDANDLLIFENSFSGNTLAGVTLLGQGTAKFSDNVIIGNGAGLDDTVEDGAGVNIDGFGSYFGLTFTNDVISNNAGDGVEITLDNVPFSTFNFVNFDGVQVNGNTGRGFDVLNAGFVTSTLEIVNSQIVGNVGEGTYVVNSASDQDQVLPTPQPTGLDFAAYNDETHGMNATASVFTDPSLILRYENNFVSANGGGSGSDGNGLVIRVGTSDGSGSEFDDGGFASNVYNAPGFDSDVSGDVYLDNIFLDRGGVVAIVRENTFAGNVGTDLLFESFTSTTDPIASTVNTGGTPNVVTSVANYQSDPKGRLDLVFDDNTFGEAGGVLTGAATIGAFYDNADPLVKSRPGNATPPPGGQFPNNTPPTRRRNAQRQDIPPGGVAVFGLDRNGNPIPGVAQFAITNPSTLFPLVGFGESTFRVNFDGENTITPSGATVSNVQLFGPIFVPFNGNVPGESLFPSGYTWNLE